MNKIPPVNAEDDIQAALVKSVKLPLMLLIDNPQLRAAQGGGKDKRSV